MLPETNIEGIIYGILVNLFEINGKEMYEKTYIVLTDKTVNLITDNASFVITNSVVKSVVLHHMLTWT